MNAPIAHLSWDTLNDYVDGDLTAAARQRAEEHLAGCEVCRGQLAKLQTVVSSARAMPAAIDAPAQAWESIKTRVESAKVIPLPGANGSRSPVQQWRLVAAAVVLIAVSSGGTAWVMRRGTPAGNVAVQSGTPALPAPVAIPVDFERTEKGYIDIVRELVTALNDSPQKLSPETVLTVQRSLKVIDDAIAEARQALVADPASNMLRGMLAKRYQQKVELLRRASERVLESE